jgi:phytoene dehydrogenase-like protein
MGGVSLAIAKAFKEAGGDIYCECPTEQILTSNGTVNGVRLESGLEIAAKTVLANPTPKVTYEHLIKPGTKPL